jgi:hypothetical protein
VAVKDALNAVERGAFLFLGNLNTKANRASFKLQSSHNGRDSLFCYMSNDGYMLAD